MGGQDSKIKVEIIERLKGFPYTNDKAISERQFVSDLFSAVDLSHINAPIGPTFISGTHILQLYYIHLTEKYRGTFSKSKAISSIEQLYDDPKKAIQCTYKLIQPNGQPYITKQQYLEYIMNCFDKGIQSILRHTKCHAEFKVCFKEWINRSRQTVLAHSEKIFQDHVQAQDTLWTEGDFRRWILSQNQWTIFVELKGVCYNIPLNMLSLLGIVLQKK